MRMWDPGQYRLFAEERSRPFYELLSRIGAIDPTFGGGHWLRARRADR